MSEEYRPGLPPVDLSQEALVLWLRQELQRLAEVIETLRTELDSKQDRS